uniref:Uncharacterized protein n=1 Tax=Arundo donax TaxID=35708 RepID=A0A0A9FHS2_ARUDO
MFRLGKGSLNMKALCWLQQCFSANVVNLCQRGSGISALGG